MGKLAADSAAVSLNNDSFQSAAPVNSFIGMEHFLIADFDTGIVDIETVEVFHHEFAQAYQTGTGAGLIAKFDLDLIDQQRQVAVALDVM